MAPGVYLAKALKRNANAYAVDYTLLPSQGELIPILSDSENLKVNFLTMLAADMDVKPDEIPSDHSDSANFLPRHFKDDRSFHIVLCGGAVLRNRNRAAYRFRYESRRLLQTQLALGLEHLRPGGTMIIFLHKLECLNNISLPRKF